MSFLGMLTGSGQGDSTLTALKNNQGALNNLDAYGQNVIGQGSQKAASALHNGISAYQPYAATGQDANHMYANALGLNGTNGNATATNAFQAGPGYQFALDQGTQAALRGASAAGMLNSGNTLTSLSQYGQGLANQEYGSWLDRLQGLGSQGLSAASGQAQQDANLANLYTGTADDRLGLKSSVVQGRIGTSNDIAKTQEQQAANQGSFLSNLLGTGISLGTKAFTGGLF